MKIGRKTVVRLCVVLAVTAVFLVPDIVTKRWAEANLANWAHLLPVKAGSDVMTVGDAVRAKFPEMKDSDLNGRVVRLPEHKKISPDDPVHELESTAGVDVSGFLVFEPDGRFARRVQRKDSLIVRRLASRGLPGKEPAKVRNQVKKALSGVTVEDFLLSRVPSEDESTVKKTIAEGLYIIPGTGLERVDPASSSEPGATYLLTERKVTVIENFWDFSYAENPAGAFSILLWLDGKLRLTIFLVFGLVAIVALGFMILKPPIDNLWLDVALGAVLGGAIGNYGDRVTLTYVVDFIHWFWRDYHWPRFNVADVGIVVGVIVLLIFSMFTKPAGKK